MTRAKRRARTNAVDWVKLIAVDPDMAEFDRDLVDDGYSRSSARAYSRKDGTFSVRCVWRKRARGRTLSINRTCVYSVAGV